MKFHGDLRPHQDEAYAAIAERYASGEDRGYCLFLEMGLGKTRVALKAIATCETGGPTLVLCPKAVIPAWVDEAAATSDAVIEVLDGQKHQRLRALARPADIYVINYEGLLVMAEELVGKGFKFLVCDESQRVSNRATRQAKVALRLAAQARFVLLMTGTPVRNDARDLWHQLLLVDGGKRLGINYWAFQSANFVNVSRNRIPNWKPKSGSEDKIRETIRDICLTKKKIDVLKDLPEKIFHRRVVQATDRQRDAYVEMAQDMVVELEIEKREGRIATARTALTRYLRLHQIAQGFLFEESGDACEEFFPNPKTKELLTILEDHAAESCNKAIVWCVYRKTIRDLDALLTDKGYNPVCLFGDTSGDGVDQVFRDDPTVRVLIGQPRAGGLGVNLTSADLAVYYTSGWSLEDYQQSQDRCHRIGSEKITNVVNYVHLEMQGTIDTLIAKALRRKADVAELLIDFRRHLDIFAEQEAA